MSRLEKHNIHPGPVSALLALVLAVSLTAGGCSVIGKIPDVTGNEAGTEELSNKQSGIGDGGSDSPDSEELTGDGAEKENTSSEDTVPDEGAEKSNAASGNTAAEQESESAAAVPFLKTYGYAYGQLNEEEQQTYCVMCESITSRDKLPVQITDQDTLSRCYAAVCADHPEYFYMSGYGLTTYSAGPLQRVCFLAQYTMDAEQQAQYEAQLEKELDEAVADLSLNAGADDYTKVKAAFDWIVRHTQYDLDAENNQNVLSVFLNHASVCNGYASAFQYLMYRLGVPCTLITGSAKGQPHAWDLIKADGDWYYTDPTFGDKETGQVFTDYNELCMTSQEMQMNHQTDASSFALPECTATADSYFIREGRYLKENDTDALQTIVDRGIADPEGIVWIRCANHDLYQQILDEIRNYTFSLKYLGGTSLCYTTFEQLYTLWVKKDE